MTSPIPSEPRTLRQLYHAPASTAVAVSITVAAISMIYVLQGTLVRFVPAIVAVGVTYILITAAVVALAKAVPFSVGLRSPPLRFWIAAVLIGLSVWYIGLQLVEWLQPPGSIDSLEHGLKRAGLAPALIAFAVMPAIAEELVFRGVLGRSLARRSTVLAIVVSAVAFSAYHVMPSQVVGTLPFSFAVATLAVRSGSVLPSMLAHFLNNATVIMLTRETVPSVGFVIGDHPAGAFVGAIAITCVGVALAARGAA